MHPLDNSMGIPAFLSKLWKMVDDPKTDDLICWSQDGKTFIIRNEVEFWYKLLPAYYKHNNMSSFVRQLNMYGFHKVSNLDNASVDSDKVEYQFLHPYFQKGQPHLLKNIKRKVTNSKVISSEKMGHNYDNEEHFTKVLADVKQLHGRQAQVDNVLSNLKQENSVLWRELAVLRQKHQKQQQIVNKLIQFLVTIVQPSTRMGGLGVKRRIPLMINENPIKKQKNNNSSDGPTIHELDSAEVLPEELFEEAESPEPAQADTAAVNASIRKVESPPSTSNSNQKSPATLLNEVDNIQTIEPEMFLESSNLQPEMDKESAGNVDKLLTDSTLAEDSDNFGIVVNDDFENEEAVLIDGEESDRVFLNPSSQDTFLTNLINDNEANGDKNLTTNEKRDAASPVNAAANMTVATRDPNLGLTRLNSINEDIDVHVGSTQNELEQLKDFFNGCNGLDTSYLLNLFNDITPYSLTPNQREDNPENSSDLLSGSALAPYDSGIVDFTELLDDSDDTAEPLKGPEDFLEMDLTDTMNTPEVTDMKPNFSISKAKYK